MSGVTNYVAIPFLLSDEGDLVPGEANDFQSEEEAKRGAAAMLAANEGAIAISRTEDPETRVSYPVILAQYGLTPGEVE